MIQSCKLPNFAGGIKMPATGESNIQDVLLDEPVNFSEAIVSSSDEEVNFSEVVKKFKTSTIVSKKTANFESLPVRREHEEFIRSCVDLLLKYAVFEGTDRKNKVLDFKTPEQLKKVFNFCLQESPSTHEELKEFLKNTIHYSVKTGHPYFANQLFSSLDPYGLVGQWLTDALNPSVYTYEVSPVFTLMEEIVLREMRKFVGYKDGEGDGIFCPGGSLANGYAINCARYNYMPEIKVSVLVFLFT